VSSNDETTDVQLDISKYKGHTPAPWETNSEDSQGVWQDHDETLPYHIAWVHSDRNWEDMTEAEFTRMMGDKQLIADAPLLLEEVKRLQHKLMLAESALGEIRAYHESGQGNLGEIIEHYQENEQVEMPNAFDEED
jgi:hypothetical protein